MGLRNWCAGILLGLIAAALPSGAGAQVIDRPDAAHLSFGAGYFDAFQQDDTAVEFRAELRSNWHLLSFLDPFVGVSGTTDGAVYGFFGLKADINIGDHFVIMPSAAVGAFGHGDGKDLGSVLEFRTGAEFAWRFEDRSRLGVGIHHISNASVGDINPGTEIVSIVYSLPLDFLR
jgi:hypothetical protein